VEHPGQQGPADQHAPDSSTLSEPDHAVALMSIGGSRLRSRALLKPATLTKLVFPDFRRT
jgi:hypothetical protein